jgi:hypothetical protein
VFALETPELPAECLKRASEIPPPETDLPPVKKKTRIKQGPKSNTKDLVEQLLGALTPEDIRLALGIETLLSEVRALQIDFAQGAKVRT